MILIVIRMKVVSEKRLELSQAISSLSVLIRMEKGCRSCDFYRSIEDENRFSLLEEWDDRENAMAHLKSEHFRVLRGAMNLLKEPYEMMLHTASDPKQLEKIQAHPDTEFITAWNAILNSKIPR